MKKLVSLTLAAAMVMSLASVAFAANPIPSLEVGTQAYKESDNAVNTEKDKNDNVIAAKAGMIGYGDMVLYPISTAKTAEGISVVDEKDAEFSDYEAAKKLKMKASWEQNEDLVKDSYVAKKRNTDKEYGYFVVVETNSASTTAKKDIIGSIKFSGSGITFGNATTPEKEVKLPVAITLGYDEIVGNGAKANESSVELTSNTEYIFKFGTDSATKLAEDEEFEINLQGKEGRFVVDTFGQGSILVGNTVKYNEGFEKKIPDANYVYVNGNGAMFNKIGWLYLNALPTDVIYQVVNDKFVKINAEYDTVEAAYVLKTRTLGKYVIAEKELDLEVINAEVVEEGTEGPVVEVPGVEVPKIENPGTGAAC